MHQSVSELADISSASSSRNVGTSRSSKRSRLSSADSTASANSHQATFTTRRPGLSTKDAPPTPPHTVTIDSDIGDLESILESVPLLQSRSCRTPQLSDPGPPSSQTNSSAPAFDDVFVPAGHAHYAPLNEVAVSSTLVIHKHLDLMFPDDGSKYFNLDDHCPGEPLRHPDPSLMFRLLHLYEQNVHPLIKVVHLPSVRERFCDVSADPSSANAHDNALMFAIYTITVNTLTGDESARLFPNTHCRDVWENFRRNTQTALCRVELWRSSHIVAIQAYLLYLLTLNKDVDPRAFGICSGNVGRMVQRLLSLHNKRTTLASAPTKAVNQEMGTRLWWEILVCDLRACEKSGIAFNPTLATATTVLPRNAPDSDLEQLARSAVPVPSAALDVPNSECLFLLLRCEIAQFQLHPPWSRQHPEHHLSSHLFRSTAAYKRLWDSNGRRSDPSSLTWRLAAVDAFDMYIVKRYFDRPETATSILMQYAQHHAHMWVKKIRLFVHLNQRSVEHDAEVIRICTVHVQETAKLIGDDRFVRFQWYTYQQLPFFSFVILLDLLRRHTTGKLVDQAWTAIASSSVIWRPDIATVRLSKIESLAAGVSGDTRSSSSKSMPNGGTPNIYADQDRRKLQVRSTMLAALMVAAWEKRAQALAAASAAESADVIEEPAIVSAMRSAAAMIFQPAPGADGTEPDSQGPSGTAAAGGGGGGGADRRSAHHVGANNSHPLDGQWTGGATDPTAFTAFLDPSLGTSSATAFDDMLHLNSLLQSSVDLDWSSWFNPSWASTPGSIGQMASPANFLPPL
ncbi:hypothetical protein EX895_006368 [Sporisorium graminicola]|uniref:Xylanolytic transcriptional activator regulatory domain-containing protein n=1 Tax=Sporisorium graminicola TaxID=280036 RepID=A0A4U7KQ30_9BASI|nr:hypothetical protein EX895_006368 [Sporisorium graminicola]TKY85288.1 hypothetical protein EX895_006368 [Sporisorium graminicola]